jgi:NADH-quinone oxidoreductase subunit K
MSAVPVDFYLALSAVLFAIGAYGVLSRRNAVGVLMGIELMLNAANINFLAFWRNIAPKAMEGQVFVLVVITVAAAEAAVGLAIILSIYRRFGTINVDDVDLMKG